LTIAIIAGSGTQRRCAVARQTKASAYALGRARFTLTTDAFACPLA